MTICRTLEFVSVFFAGVVVGLFIGFVVNYKYVKDAESICSAIQIKASNEVYQARQTEAEGLAYFKQCGEIVKEARTDLQTCFVKEEISTELAKFWQAGFDKEHRAKIDCQQRRR